MVRLDASFGMPGDPIRNVRWTFPADQYPWLTYPGQEENAGWKGKNTSPQQIRQISFFVDRKGQIVLVSGGELIVDKGMKSDALREK